MIDQLLSLGTEQITKVLSENSTLSSHQLPDAAQAITSALGQQVGAHLQTGNVGILQELLSGKESLASSPVIAQLIQPLATSLAEKVGLDGAQAASVVQSVLPHVFNMFNQKVQTAQSSGFDVQDAVSQVGQGNLGSVMGLVSALTSETSGGNDGFGLDDVMKLGQKFF